MLPLEEVNTPGTKTIEEVANFLGMDQSRTIKALLFVTYDEEGKENSCVLSFSFKVYRESNSVSIKNKTTNPIVHR